MWRRSREACGPPCPAPQAAAHAFPRCPGREARAFFCAGRPWTPRQPYAMLEAKREKKLNPPADLGRCKMAGKRWMPFYSDGSLWPLSLGQPQPGSAAHCGGIPGRVPAGCLPAGVSPGGGGRFPGTSQPGGRLRTGLGQPHPGGGHHHHVYRQRTVRAASGKGVRPAPGWGQPGARTSWTACIPPFRIR